MDERADEVSVRIGDAERRVVDERLQQAVGDGLLTLGEYDERAGLVWAARTRADLAQVTRDLPAPEPFAAVDRAPIRSASARGQGRGRRRVVAVLSSDALTAPVGPGQDVAAYAVLGNAVVDLRRQDLPAHLRVHATCVLGHIEVLVPQGTTVHMSGVGVLGSRELHVEPGRAGGPVVDVEGYAALGSIEVSHGSDYQESGAAVDLRKHQVARQPGHSVRRRGPRTRRPPWLLAVAAVAIVGAVGFQVSGQDRSVVFGSTVYQVPPDRTDVHVGMLFGSAKVVIPDKARAEVGGTVVFGSTECNAACDTTSGAGRVLHVHVIGGFGSVQVLTQAEAAGDQP